MQAQVVSDAMRELRKDLSALARFFEASNEVTVSEFFAYAGPLAWASGIAQAWEWVPVVPAAARSGFENRMRRQGYTTFRIFEKDGQGLAVDAGEREAYYPVAYLAPVAGNSSAMGFDLGSEAIRQAALQESLSSRLPTATAPLFLVQETEQQKGIAIYHPILAAGSVRVSGFAVCVLRLQSALQVALVGGNVGRPPIRMRLLDLAASGGEAMLAAFPISRGRGCFPPRPPAVAVPVLRVQQCLGAQRPPHPGVPCRPPHLGLAGGRDCHAAADPGGGRARGVGAPPPGCAGAEGPEPDAGAAPAERRAGRGPRERAGHHDPGRRAGPGRAREPRGRPFDRPWPGRPAGASSPARPSPASTPARARGAAATRNAAAAAFAQRSCRSFA